VTRPATRVVPFGDGALLATTADVPAAHELARRVTTRRATAPGDVDEVVVGFASVLVVLADPPPATGADRGGTPVHAADGAEQELTDTAAWLADLADSPPDVPGDPDESGATHVLGVTFDGPDLADVAGTLGTDVAGVAALLCGADLEVAFVGFAPGFPYLVGLPDDLAALPRRATPRTSVPAGSVAVAGGFASVYPRATPGGWHLLGRTGATLFDARRPPHSTVAPGDRVRFVVDPAPRPDGTGRAAGSDRPPLVSTAPMALVVEEAGLCDLVQDRGRSGCAALGVPRAGAADPGALTLVNLLLGNDPGAAAVECTGTGPRLRVVGDGHVAVLGTGPGAVDVAVDGRSVPDGAVVPVRHGQTVAVGPVRRGLRAYVGVAGGLRTPELFGSRSSDVLAGLGPGRLRAGDVLARGGPGRVRGTLAHPPADRSGRPTGERADASPGAEGRTGAARPTVLRVLPGPHTTGTDGQPDDGRFDRLVAGPWHVGDHVDRVGVRLAPAGGGGIAGGGQVASVPMVTGAVQVPPDGHPIVLLPDHATVGGYPVVACVIRADLARLGQLAPGDAVAFVPVDPAGAAAALARHRTAVASAVSGWFPTATGT
jgi:biotin-dependent carboxylase-like uncharacterized protein